MDCFVPLMEEFHEVYGAYPKYPVALSLIHIFSQKKDIALLENFKIIAGLTSDICT